MIELLINLTYIERIILMIMAFISIMFALYIIKAKNIIKNKDGFSLVSNKNKNKENIKTSNYIEPNWSKTISNSEGKEDEIGFITMGNYLKIYGNRWNSALDKQGYALIRELIDSTINVIDQRIKYSFWILDISSCNIQSSLISLIIDKSELFEKIYIITNSKNLVDLKAVSPTHSKISNIVLVISDEN